MYSFEYPYVLLTIFIFILCHYFCKEKTSTYYLPHLSIYKKVSKQTLLITFLKFATISFALFALSSPFKSLDTKLIKDDGLDIILSLDSSSSMRAIGFNQNDLEENRWQVVSSIVKDFILTRVNDNIGLVIFGTSVMTASPLSYDKETQSEIIKYLDIGVVGAKTAMIDSIASSTNILKTSKAKSKIIILLTDGEDTASSIPLSIAIKLAIKHKVKIYSIGIGESNTRILKYISSQTNGKTFQANNSDDLKKIYDEINQLEKSKINKNKIILKEYLYNYPLLASLFCLIALVFIKNRE